MNTMKKIWSIRRDEALLHLIILGMAVVMGIILDIVFRNEFTENDFGVIFFVAFFTLYMDYCFIQLFNFGLQVRTALQFGITRREYLKGHIAFNVIFVAGEFLLLLLIVSIEHLALGSSISFLPGDIMVSPAAGLLCIFLLGMCIYFWIEALVGNALMKFGKIAFWIYYVIFFGSFIVFSKVIGSDTFTPPTWLINGLKGLLDGITGTSLLPIPILLVLICLAVLVNYQFLKRQSAA